VKQGACPEFKITFFVTVDISTDEVGWQQVGGELDAVVIAFDGFCQCFHCRCLGKPRHALDQQMTFADQADEHAVDEFALADHLCGYMLAYTVQQCGIHAAVIADAVAFGQFACLLKGWEIPGN
jgi:hypothetical protein